MWLFKTVHWKQYISGIMCSCVFVLVYNCVIMKYVFIFICDICNTNIVCANLSDNIKKESCQTLKQNVSTWTHYKGKTCTHTQVGSQLRYMSAQATSIQKHKHNNYEKGLRQKDCTWVHNSRKNGTYIHYTDKITQNWLLFSCLLYALIIVPTNLKYSTICIQSFLQ